MNKTGPVVSEELFIDNVDRRTTQRTALKGNGNIKGTVIVSSYITLLLCIRVLMATQNFSFRTELYHTEINTFSTLYFHSYNIVYRASSVTTNNDKKPYWHNFASDKRVACLLAFINCHLELQRQKDIEEKSQEKY